MRKVKYEYIIFIRKLERRDRLGKLGIGGRMILNCTLKRTGHGDLMYSESSTEYSGGLL